MAGVPYRAWSLMARGVSLSANAQEELCEETAVQKGKRWLADRTAAGPRDLATRPCGIREHGMGCPRQAGKLWQRRV